MMNEALHEKLIQQIESKMKHVIEEYTIMPNSTLLDLPFVDLGQMDDLRCAVENDVLDLDSHPALVKALKHGGNLGEAFWVTLIDANYAYGFSSEYPEYDAFLDDVEQENLEVA